MNEAYEYRVSVQPNGDPFSSDTEPLIDLERVDHQYPKACEDLESRDGGQVTLQRRLLVAPWEPMKTLTV